MMASGFAANWGSLLTLNVRDRWGFRPCLCQIRRTLFSLTPTALAMLAPTPRHPRPRDSNGFGHAACAPVCGVARFLLSRFPDHVLDFGRPDCRGSARARGVFVPKRETAAPPARSLLRHDSQFGRNLLILHSTRSQQDDPGTLHAARRSASGTRT